MYPNLYHLHSIGQKRRSERRRDDDYYKHQAEYDMDIQSDPNLIKLHYYLDGDHGHAQTIHTNFIVQLVREMNLKRRLGFVRVFLKTGDRTPISLLIRCFNAYINGLHDGENLYEIGSKKKERRYFKDCLLTGYTENYPDLLGKKSLIGLRLGPKQFRKDVLQVEKSRGEPLKWKEPIARFAFIFSESGRFIWIREDLGEAFKSEEAFKSGEDIVIEIDTRYEYMASLPRMWSDICKAAREEINNDDHDQMEDGREKTRMLLVTEVINSNIYDQMEDEAAREEINNDNHDQMEDGLKKTEKNDNHDQMEDGLKKTKKGCDMLKRKSVYAKAALGFETVEFQGAQSPMTTGDTRGRETRSRRSVSPETRHRSPALRRSPSPLRLSPIQHWVEALLRVERQTPSGSFDSGSEESDHKRPKRKDVTSDDDDSHDSRKEDKKKAKRRPKEESGSEESDHKKKRKRSKRKAVTSDADDSNDSRRKDRKKGKRRRKNERDYKKSDYKEKHRRSKRKSYTSGDDDSNDSRREDRKKGKRRRKNERGYKKSDYKEKHRRSKRKSYTSR